VEAITMFLAMIIGLVALDAASMIWGADSREQYRDDHGR
jgi:nitrogen fixation-related uncharacterized protein